MLDRQLPLLQKAILSLLWRRAEFLRGLSEHILFLAGSAINSIQNAAGKPDPGLGAEAMQQALEVHRSGELRAVPVGEHLRALLAVAERKQLQALRQALRQRYPQRT